MLRSASLIAVLVLAGTAGATWIAASSFLGAPAGVALPFDALQLPEVKISSIRPLPADMPEAFTPSYDQLLYGNTVITTEAQMKKVWGLLFAEPYSPRQFDFDKSFVVLMSAGATWYQTFGISSVEQVDATYTSFGFGFGSGTDIDKFLSITSFEFLPGIMPQDPPPGKFRVSGVRISNDYFDDCVFHRSVAFGV